jgi:hypothetical protein
MISFLQCWLPLSPYKTPKKAFYYLNKAEFVQKLLRDKNIELAVSFNHVYRYIDDVLSINNHNFHNYVHLIYPDELKIKDKTESDKSASYLDILLNIDSNGRLTTTLYDKRDDFTLQSSTFLFYVVIYHFHLLMVCTSPRWFDIQEHVLRTRTFQSETNYWQNSWCCRVIMNLV